MELAAIEDVNAVKRARCAELVRLARAEVAGQSVDRSSLRTEDLDVFECLKVIAKREADCLAHAQKALELEGKRAEAEVAAKAAFQKLQETTKRLQAEGQKLSDAFMVSRLAVETEKWAARDGVRWRRELDDFTATGKVEDYRPRQAPPVRATPAPLLNLGAGFKLKEHHVWAAKALVRQLARALPDLERLRAFIRLVDEAVLVLFQRSSRIPNAMRFSILDLQREGPEFERTAAVTLADYILRNFGYLTPARLFVERLQAEAAAIKGLGAKVRDFLGLDDIESAIEDCLKPHSDMGVGILITRLGDTLLDERPGRVFLDVRGNVGD